MLFLRVTPLIPNWFVNVASPIVGVPISTFAIATFIGECYFPISSQSVMSLFQSSVIGEPQYQFVL